MQVHCLPTGVFVSIVLIVCGASAAGGVHLAGRLFPWLVSRRDDAPGETILWWELRRIPYNFLIGSYGILCLLVFACGIEASGELKPGDDAVEPMALFVAPCFINVCYTFGWFVELILTPIIGRSTRIGPFLFRLGLGFSLFVISIPAVYWATEAWLRALHIAR